MTESGSASFGDAAGEMANETEVEAPAKGASASAGHRPPTANEPGPEDTSGVCDMVEEGAPMEPVDVQDDPRVSDPEIRTEAEQATAAAEAELAERTVDLQRLQAEYANYRKRVERDRQLIVENATYRALAPITEVLDTIDRAREHGEVEGGFKAVAEQLEATVANLGLIRFGAPGDAFDPNLHEALSHMGSDPDVDVVTCKHIAKAGYKIGDRVVRAAQVLVVDPVEG